MFILARSSAGSCRLRAPSPPFLPRALQLEQENKLHDHPAWLSTTRLRMSLPSSSSSFVSSAGRFFSSTPPAASRVGSRILRVPPEVTLTLIPPLLPSSPAIQQEAVADSLTQGAIAAGVAVSGPLGALQLPLPEFARVTITPPNPTSGAPEPILRVAVANPKDKQQRSMWGTLRTLIGNMVDGVTDGYTVPVKLVGVGYRATLEMPGKGDDAKGALPRLSLKLGHSHPIVLTVPEGVVAKVPAPQRIVLQGIDLNKVTQFAADIRKWRPPEPYNQKGVFVGDETIKKKEGKKR
ncbi:ribosomal protein L6, alpha-beta domain-containing protein [Zopfochytrium polystomum]|nr:ribosomal protein L6, alpha-beta domain-containing protein [Zopfochytrium polystomum]